MIFDHAHWFLSIFLSWIEFHFFVHVLYSMYMYFITFIYMFRIVNRLEPLGDRLAEYKYHYYYYYLSLP